jgi:L-malate glycosyltransferase
MKILYFTRGQTPHDLRFLTALSTSGHSVAVLCLDHGVGRVWPKGIVELRWPRQSKAFSWVNAPMLAREFRRIVADYKPDVIHAGPIQSPAFVAALAGCTPLVSMSWGSDLLKDADRSPIWRCVTRYTLKHTTVLAADAQTVVDAARRKGFAGPARIFPWGVDLEHFKPGPIGNLRKRLGWEKNIVFLSIRAFEKLYGVELIARAFAQAAQNDSNIRLLLFGKGSQEPSIRSILQNADVMHRVYFGGFAGLEELPDIYNSADYFISASHSDGSSVSLMEALACAKPALVSDIPSNREWIKPGQQGWLFRDGDSDALAELMLLAARKSDRKVLSLYARELAEKRADWKKNFQVLLDAYQEAVEIKNAGNA